MSETNSKHKSSRIRIEQIIIFQLFLYIHNECKFNFGDEFNSN